MAARGDKKQIIAKISENGKNGVVGPGGVQDSFRTRQLAEVLRILKRPTPLDSEIYEGE
jgi:hypothetical protein